MDEAHMVGLGKYLDQHGYRNRQEIMQRHLEMVLSICKQYGFTVQMWSDMFFRLAFHGAYYENDVENSGVYIYRRKWKLILGLLFHRRSTLR